MENKTLKTLKTMEEAEINVVTFGETDIVATSGIAPCAVDGGCTSDGICVADSCTSDSCTSDSCALDCGCDC